MVAVRSIRIATALSCVVLWAIVYTSLTETRRRNVTLARQLALLVFGAGTALAVIGIAACGGSSNDGGPNPSSDGGSDAALEAAPGDVDSGDAAPLDAGDPNVVAHCADTTIDITGCTHVLSAGSTDTTTLETALVGAKSSSQICLCPGTYRPTDTLSLTVPNVTVRGLGANIDDVTLDFSGFSGGAALLVEADGFTAQNFAVKNTPGNAVTVSQADAPTFRKLHVAWDSATRSTHGAVGLYADRDTHVLVENCEVAGANDSAIYIGQGDGLIVRSSKAHDSVIGLRVENVSNGELYDNEAYGNTTGIGLFLLGNLTTKTASQNLIHDNNVHDNNAGDVAAESSLAAGMSPGTGILVIGTSNTEIRNNTVSGNEGAALLVASYAFYQTLVSTLTTDAQTDGYPDHIFIHGNTFADNGTSPQPWLTQLGVDSLESVLWDGWTASGSPTDATVSFCLGSANPWPSFRMFDGANLTGTPAPSTDTTPYECDLTAITGNAP